MQNILGIIQTYLINLAEPVAVLVIGILTVIVTKNSKRYDAAKDRLLNTYHPIFQAIEPHLFMQISRSDAKKFIAKFKEIENVNSLYIYPSLRHWVSLLSNFIDSDEDQSKIDECWYRICNYVNKDYDILCKTAHIPLRSVAYRMNNKQFTSVYELLWGLFKLALFPNLILILFFVCSLVLLWY